MKVCFVGTGSIGKRHITNLYNLCIKIHENLVIHVLRSRKKQLDALLVSMIDKEIYSIDEMDDFYDAIFICNPTFKHYDSINELKSYAKYFFVEKPVFDSIHYQIDELKLPNDNLYYVACPLRYNKVLMRAKAVLKNKKVISVQAISSSYLPEWRKGVDYRETYSAKREEGGGVQIDLIHEWDYLVELFGYPDKVLSFVGQYSDLEITSDDIAVYIAQYEDKLVELHLDYFGRMSKRYLRVWTTSGEYLFDILNNRVYRDGECIEYYEEERNEMYLREMEYFIEIMKGKHSSSNTLEHALEIMKIADSKPIYS